MQKPTPAPQKPAVVAAKPVAKPATPPPTKPATKPKPHASDDDLFNSRK